MPRQGGYLALIASYFADARSQNQFYGHILKASVIFKPFNILLASIYTEEFVNEVWF